MELLVIGLSHRTAPVEVRERLAVVPTDTESYLRAVTALPGVKEAALISTCNRVEIYAAFSDGPGALAALREHLGGRLPTGSPAQIDLDRHLYRRIGREAVHHLFRVAASLDSLVVGEPQILGQLKESFETARRHGTAGQVLGFAFPHAFRVARRVRRETGIARQPTSVSSVAVELARQVWEGFEGRQVLLIGAGKMGDLAARSLRASGANVIVTNRTAARADELAARLGCKAEPFTDLPALLTAADIVITSTGSRQPLLLRSQMEKVQRARRGRPLVIIDIAVPRDVEPQVGELEGIFLWDIDALQKVAAENLGDRRVEADRAEVMVEEELTRFVASHRGRGVGPTISALRARFAAYARAEADKAIQAMPTLDERQQRAVHLMAESLANKLLHAPSVALRKAGAGDDPDALAAAVQQLFDLPGTDGLSEGPGGADKKDAES